MFFGSFDDVGESVIGFFVDVRNCFIEVCDFLFGEVGEFFGVVVFEEEVFDGVD